MLSRALLAVALAGALILSTACADSIPPVAPPAATVPPPATSPPIAASFPALSRAGAIYAADASLYGFSSYHSGWLMSRLVLYEENRFGLQFSSLRWGFHEYGGSYTRTGSVIEFAFDASNTAGPWLAVGTLHGDSLAVQHNDVMRMADFVDGVYVRVLVTP